MKTLIKVPRVILFMIFLFSCDWPETVVTTFVHPDGSVTRRVVMKNNKEVIDPSTYRVPVDSTWKFSRTTEMKDKDTILILTAEKDFRSVEEINRDYENDQGVNRMLRRQAFFSRKFRWFNTYHHYSEKVGQILNVSVKAGEVMSNSILNMFYMPDPLVDSLVKSPDSLYYKKQKEKTDSLAEKYVFVAVVEEWMMNYLQLVPDTSLVRAKKEELLELSLKEAKEDSLFIAVFGEIYYNKNKTAIDSAMNKVDTVFSKALSSKFYTMEASMPGELVSSNGFIKSGNLISWPVDSKYFLSQDYSMNAVSKTVNLWAWIVTSAVVVLLLTGFIYITFKTSKKPTI